MNMDELPVKGQTYEHTKTGNRYLVLGTSYNSITDRIDVKYAPCYDCEFPEFNRQLMGHPKAWMTANEDGTPRFRKVAEIAEIPDDAC